MKNSIRFKKLIILLGDVIVLLLSLRLTLSLRYSQNLSQDIWLQHLWSFSFVFVGWLIVFYIMGLYNLHLAINNTKFIKKIINGIIIVGFLSTIFFYLNLSSLTPKTNLALFITIFAIIFLVWRRFFNWSIRNHVPKTNIAIIGFNEQARELANKIKNEPQLGYNVSFILNDMEMRDEIDGIPVVKNIYDLEKLVAEKKVQIIVMVSYPHKLPELRNALFLCLKLKVNYTNLPTFYEDIIGKIPVDAINQMWFLENLNEGNMLWFNIFKRTYDLLFAIFIMIITLPFWPIIALAIKIESKGPVFFKQIRNGQNNKEFSMIKFRTMTVGNNDFAPTAENDIRITKIGSFLRKTRIDEIPQIINVLKGEMSFVGPRPERPEIAKKLKLSIPFYDERMLVKPGLTGWDQISGEYHSPSVEDTYKKLQYDLFYIKNRSIYLDISIILKTISTVLSRSGR